MAVDSVAGDSQPSRVNVNKDMTESLTAIELQPADIVVGATACTTAEAVCKVADALRDAGHRRGANARSVIVHPPTVRADEVVALRGPDSTLQLVPTEIPQVGRLPFSAADGRDLFRPLAAITEQVGAKACGLIGAQADGISADLVRPLVTPVVDHRIDLVLPCYPRHRLDGLINTGIVFPFTRALYGKRVDGQLGIDFGLSPRFLRLVAQRHTDHAPQRPIWLLTEATESGMEVAQAQLRNWLPPVEQTADLSTALAQVLGSLFEDTEYHASTWQRARGSHPVATFGEAAQAPDEHRTVDVRSMIESFQIGLRNLQDVWGRLLPPASLVELNRMARLDPSRFHMPESLWARIVFDFALGHRLRVISRQHLLGAMTPLYLAWVASFALQVGAADRATARDAVERLCVAYESEKRYLLARWRWPDRFNP
jgi:hypothetical protein